MKKILSVLLIALIAISLTGCGEKEQTMVCSKNVDLQTLYGVEGSLEVEMTATYVGDKVLKVSNHEKIIVSDSDIYNEFENLYNQLIDLVNGIEHYEVDLVKTDSSFEFKANIDYELLDLEAFKKIDAGISTFINEDGNISISKMETVFELMGSTCEK